jgi:transcriptional regulator with XRE-family HTH domain
MQEHGIRPTPSDAIAWRRAASTRAKSGHHQALGHVVRVTRARLRLSQEALGERAGLHRNYVGAIERGEINPTFRVLLKLERGLGVSLSELISLTEKEMSRPCS